jgi:hypothetical protein
VGPLVDHPSGVDDDHPVGQAERGAAVGDDQRGPTPHQLAEGGVDLLLGLGVDRRGGVVQDEDAGIGEQGPGERHPLALPARQAEAALPHDRVVAIGQVGHEPGGAGGPGGGPHLVVGGVGPAVGDVGPDRVGEQEALLEHDADVPTQRLEGDVAHVDTVDPDRSPQHVVEAGQQQGHRRLTRSRRTDQGDHLARLDPEIEAGQDGVDTAVAEAHVVEGDGTPHVAEGAGARALDDHRVGVEQVEDALSSGAGLLAVGQNAGHHPHRSHQLDHVGGEGQEGTQRDAPLDGQPAPEGEHPHLGEGRHRLQGGSEAGLQLHHPQA